LPALCVPETPPFPAPPTAIPAFPALGSDGGSDSAPQPIASDKTATTQTGRNAARPALGLQFFFEGEIWTQPLMMESDAASVPRVTLRAGSRKPGAHEAKRA
jgi:hypothetical protein